MLCATTYNSPEMYGRLSPLISGKSVKWLFDATVTLYVTGWTRLSAAISTASGNTSGATRSTGERYCACEEDGHSSENNYGQKKVIFVDNTFTFGTCVLYQ